MKRILFLFLLLPFAGQAQIITTFCGNGTSAVSSEGVPATATSIYGAGSGTFDNIGNYYFSQGIGNSRISKVSANYIITTVAGTSSAGYGGDGGPATLAKLKYPNPPSEDNLGNIYIPDGNNNRIRKVDISTGIISTIAGTGTPGLSGDNSPATAAMIYGPSSIDFDKYGNLFFADCDNARIRKINNFGIISTVVGTTYGFSGDGSPATNAQIDNVLCIKFDALGNLFMADEGNRRIRKMDTFGIITTVAGNGSYLYSGDNIPATSAQFDPFSIAIDKNNNLYIADHYNNRIRKIDSTGIIHTVSGTGVGGYNGDGILATTAQLNWPEGVALDVCGNLYIADNLNARIRKITYPPTLTVPVISLSGINTAIAGTTVTLTATVTNVGSSYLIHWMNHGIEFSTTTIPSVTYTKPAGIDTIIARVVPTGYGCWDSTTSAAHIVAVDRTGINNITSGVIGIYPNPAHNELTIIAGNKISNVTISNLIGQVVYSEVASSHAMSGGLWKVNIENLPAGVYVVKITDSEGVKTVSKFVKE